MENFSIWLFGISAMVIVGGGWTIFGFLMGKAPKLGIDATALIFAYNIIEFIVGIAAALCGGIPEASLKGWLIGFGILTASGFVNYFQLEIMSRAMQKGPNGIIWTITQSGFVFPFAMGIIFFHVPLNPMRLTGFILIIASLTLFGAMGEKRVTGQWKLLAAEAFIATGFSQIFSNLPSYFQEADPITPPWRTAAVALGMLIGCLAVRAGDLKHFLLTTAGELKRKEFCLLSALGGLSNAILSFFFLYPGMNALADRRVNAGAIAYPIMVCSCLIIFELYTIAVLREKRSFAQIAALILCICGAVGISV